MSKTIKLSKNLTRDINDMCQHFIEEIPYKSLSQDYEELRDMTRTNNRFKLTITLKDIVPECQDIILNLIVKEILCIIDDDKDDTNMMNGFYQYLGNTYSWANERDCDYLLKATTIETLEYCVQWVIDVTS